MGYRGSGQSGYLLGTLSDTIFRKKGLQVWDIVGSGQSGYLLGTLFDTIFRKKGLQVWDIGGVDKVVTC